MGKKSKLNFPCGKSQNYIEVPMHLSLVDLRSIFLDIGGENTYWLGGGDGGLDQRGTTKP
jgi:hypothetical protein